MTDSIQAALDELLTAFPPQPIETERMFERWGVGYGNSQAFRTDARGKRWDELPVSFLEFHHDALLFMNPGAVSDVIPAYLAAALRRDPGLDMLPAFLLSVLNRSVERERFDERFEHLLPAKRQAITHALEAWAAALEGSHNQTPVIQALESYWRTIRSGS